MLINGKVTCDAMGSGWMDLARERGGRIGSERARARACLSRRNRFLFARGFAVLPFCPFSAVLPHLGHFVFLPEAETKLPNSHLTCSSPVSREHTCAVCIRRARQRPRFAAIIIIIIIANTHATLSYL